MTHNNLHLLQGTKIARSEGAEPLDMGEAPVKVTTRRGKRCPGPADGKDRQSVSVFLATTHDSVVKTLESGCQHSEKTRSRTILDEE